MNDTPLQLIIFGITGDLARRKLLPALYSLNKFGLLPKDTQIIGISRRQIEVNDTINEMTKFIINPDKAQLDKIASMIKIKTMDVTQESDYAKLLDYLKSSALPNSQRIYYLSIPANAFIDIVTSLGKSGHSYKFQSENNEPKLLVEKPFGHDIESATELIKLTNTYFYEPQVFRIDHYLAKETAQNILTFRFKNPLFETIWNTKHIESIQISTYEEIGIEGRVNFYEQTGALRDIIQSHLLQVLALITMERPLSLDSSEIHRSKQRLLDSIMPIQETEVWQKSLRGQYDSYRQETNNPNSVIETYAKLNLIINNEQWRKTSITIDAGKAMKETRSKITVNFRSTEDAEGPNSLIFRLQPNEGITIRLQAKKPGTSNDTEMVNMDFDYKNSFADRAIEAYERVIIDAIRGDQSLFASNDEVVTSWKIVQSVVNQWKLDNTNLIFYPQGSNGLD